MAKVLVVDDEEYIVDLLSLLLEDNGHTAIPAYNGRQALDLALREQPALVIADVMMPLMDGDELLAAIREAPSIARTPVVLMSALGSMRSKGAADDFVAKPFDLDLLRRVISKHLRDNVKP
jgi:CheY-like chemotaxis protein